MVPLSVVEPGAPAADHKSILRTHPPRSPLPADSDYSILKTQTTNHDTMPHMPMQWACDAGMRCAAGIEQNKAERRTALIW